MTNLAIQTANNFVIPFNTVQNDFNEFLEIEGNSRIFFSGKYGIGKTYFIRNFFNDHEKFDSYHLFPINYQISSNEDILQLIKYDLLVELINKNKDIFLSNKVDGLKEKYILFYSWYKERLSINSFLTGTITGLENLFQISPDPIHQVLGKLGRPLKDILELDKEYQEFINAYQEGDKGEVRKYLEELKPKNFSEPDLISGLLQEKIELQKNTKKSVLILDDLDRIDPEHIFRILNVFSAFFEQENENKFGFDKIILVADYNNLKSIFHHRYGSNTDFSGYIDKYFSIDPFYFDNRKAINDAVDNIVKSIKNSEPNLSSSFDSSGYLHAFLRYIFSKAISLGLINLRELLKATKFELSELKKGSYHEDPFVDGFQMIFDKSIRVAIHCFSSIEKFKDVVEAISKNKFETEIRFPVGPYILSMFKSLKVEVSETGSFNWHNYQIKKNPDRLEGVDVEKGQKEQLFCELLITYIDSRKYLRADYHEYK